MSTKLLDRCPKCGSGCRRKDLPGSPKFTCGNGIRSQLLMHKFRRVNDRQCVPDLTQCLSRRQRSGERLPWRAVPSLSTCPADGRWHTHRDVSLLAECVSVPPAASLVPVGDDGNVARSDWLPYTWVTYPYPRDHRFDAVAAEAWLGIQKERHRLDLPGRFRKLNARCAVSERMKSPYVALDDMPDAVWGDVDDVDRVDDLMAQYADQADDVLDRSQAAEIPGEMSDADLAYYESLAGDDWEFDASS